MSRKTTLIILLAVVILWTGIIYVYRGVDREQLFGEFKTTPSIVKDTKTETQLFKHEPAPDPGRQPVDELASIEIKRILSYEYTGDIVPATQVRNRTGSVQATFQNGMYSLTAEITGAADPGEAFFYEGWLVRIRPFHFISIGPLRHVEGKYISTYRSRTDLRDHDIYLVTREKDDANPALTDILFEARLGYNR